MTSPGTSDPARRSLAAQLTATQVFVCDTSLGEAISLELPPLPGTVMFHLVVDGECTVQGSSTHHRLGPGDLALLPHGDGHSLRHDPEIRGAQVSLHEAPRQRIGGVVERLELGSPVATRLVCGALELDHPAAPSLPAVLPELITTEHSSQTDTLRTLTDLVLAEVTGSDLGWLDISSHLVDALALKAVRVALAASAATGPWAALQDPHLARALQAVVDDPGRPWTVQRLATVAGRSRSAFAQDFQAGVGEPVMGWVTRHRMRVARQRLAQGDPVSAVARAVGYDSEVAFRRAFTRSTGVTPGAVRRPGARLSARAPRAGGRG